MTRKIIEICEKFRKDHNLDPPKCISDKILLYLRYGLDKIQNDYFVYKTFPEAVFNYKGGEDVYGHKYIEYNRYETENQHHVYIQAKRKLTDEEFKDLSENCKKLYEQVRGNFEYTNKNPIITAASILYICSVIAMVELSQTTIADIYGVATPSVQKYYTQMKKDFDI